jgi:hypothetical protein
MVTFVGAQLSISDLEVTNHYTNINFAATCNNFQAELPIASFDDCSPAVKSYFLTFMSNIQQFDFHDKANVELFIRTQFNSLSAEPLLSPNEKLLVGYGLEIAYYSYHLWELNLN